MGFAERYILRRPPALLKRGHEEVFIELVHVELSEMCVNLASCENSGLSFETAKGCKKSVDGIHIISAVRLKCPAEHLIVA
jgi:hypothetical protein